MIYGVVGNVCGVAPGGVDATFVQVPYDAVDGGGVVRGIDVREKLLGETVGDDDVVSESLDEGAGYLGGNGGEPVHPIGGEARRENGDGNHSPAETAGVGVAQHQAAIGGDVCAADFDDAAFALGLVEGGDQVCEEVVDGDGLDAGVDPLGANHNRQAFGQVADHFEGDAAGADDDGGAEFGDGDAAFAQRLAGVLAGA